MEEDIKILECENVGDLASIGLIDLLNEENGYDLNRLKQQAIENLIKGYRKLERTVKIKNGDIEWMQNKINKHFIDDVTLQRDYIPKSKVKEKIEELKNGIKNDMRNCNKVKDANWKLAIQRSMAQKIETKKVLQELMEDK